MATQNLENEPSQNGCSRTRVKRIIKSNLLIIFTLIGAICGIILGLLLRHFQVSRHTVKIVSFPGDIFIRAIFMLVVPILFSSIISGITGIRAQKLGGAGLRITIYYLTTTFLASSIGVILGLTMQPGGGTKENNTTNINEQDNRTAYINIFDIILDLLRNLIPSNILRATMHSETTKYKTEDVLNYTKESTRDNNTTLLPLEGHVTYTDDANFLGIILFSIVFGIALKQIGDEVHFCLNYFQVLLMILFILQGNFLQSSILGFNKVMTKMVNYVMLYMPVGVLFLIAGSVATAKSFEDSFKKLGMLILATFAGLTIHIAILTVGNFLFTRKNPFRFIIGLKSSMLIAFATTSSLAALPYTIRCMEENIGISKEIASLVLPIGATVNMDAGAIAGSLTSIYIAQLHNITLGFGSVLKIGFYSAFTSIGASAIPQSFFAALLIILKSCDIPIEGIELLFTIEWIMDCFKTSLNVYGDCVGANFVDTLQKRQDEYRNRNSCRRTPGRLTRRKK